MTVEMSAKYQWYNSLVHECNATVVCAADVIYLTSVCVAAFHLLPLVEDRSPVISHPLDASNTEEEEGKEGRA